MYETKVLADSVSPEGVRLFTVQVTYPRIVHAEVMTHRMFDRNSASTRAIPLINQLRNLINNPFIPESFGTNQRGMQPAEPLTGSKLAEAENIWLRGRDRAVTTAIELILGDAEAKRILHYNPGWEYVDRDVLKARIFEIADAIPKTSDNDLDLSETTLLNVHKQLAGRGLEAYMWHSVIITATEWSNFFGLRDHLEAQGEIATLARNIRQAYDESTPTELDYGQWHLPLVEKGEFDDMKEGIMASAARCAAKSYNREDVRTEASKLFERYGLLVQGGHMSPLGHQARPFSRQENAVRRNAQLHARAEAEERGLDPLVALQIAEGLEFNGNLRGWHSHRKDIINEHDFSLIRAERAKAEAKAEAEREQAASKG